MAEPPRRGRSALARGVGSSTSRRGPVQRGPVSTGLATADNPQDCAVHPA